MVHTREPSGPTSNSSSSSHLGTPRSQLETRSHLNQQDILTALLQTPLALPECTVSPPSPFSPLLGCMHCLYCTEKGRDSRSEEERMERGQAQHRPSRPTSLSLLPSRRGKGVVFAWEVFLPVPQPDVLGGAGASGRASL